MVNPVQTDSKASLSSLLLDVRPQKRGDSLILLYFFVGQTRGREMPPKPLKEGLNIRTVLETLLRLFIDRFRLGVFSMAKVKVIDVGFC